MRVAIVSFYLPSGSKSGVGYQVHYLANELVKQGMQVVVFSRYGRPPDAVYEVVTLPVRSPLSAFRFFGAVARQDYSAFDLVHAVGNDTLLWGRQRPPHLRVFHGAALAEARHATGGRARLRQLALATTEYLTGLVADRCIAVSENTRRYLPFVQGIIPDGVDTARFRSGAERASHPTVLFVGTLHGRKRGAMLLDIFRREIQPRLPEAQLWMVCEERFELPGVRATGRVSEEELIDLYRRAWVFCLPSSYEGFGVPYVEAMACGTPVVATPNPGAREVLADGQFGLLVARRSLGQALLDLLTNAELRADLGRRGWERAQEFSWPRVAAQYLDCYRSLVASRRAATAEPSGDKRSL